MSHFTGDEIAYLTREERTLARIATISRDGSPHVTPVGYSYDTESDTIEIRGINLAATKKYRDLANNPNVAVVVDDVLPPWKPRGVEVRGRAELLSEPEPVIRIIPERIVSWGLESENLHHRHARSTGIGTGSVRGAREGRMDG
jgi:pyridoxamine 5'-phosphate oxidase family protein